MSMRVAVTGATGLIGRALCRALMDRGDAVVALSRRPDSVPEALPDAVPAAWPAPPGSFPEVDAVIHLAGEPVAGRWTEEKKRAIRRSRTAGTRELVEAFAHAPARPTVLISASAVGYYGDRGDEILTEISPAGAGFLPEVCVAWEEAAARAGVLGVRVAMLRTGIVLDPAGGALAQMLPPFRMGLGGPMGDGRQWFPWIHRDDIVGLYLHVLDNGISGPVNGTAPSPVRQRDFAHDLGAVLGRHAVIPTPKLGLRLLYGEFAQTLFEGQRVIPEVALQTAYSFRFPGLDGALRALLAEDRPSI